MSKIVRTPSRVEGGITPEEKQRLDAHAAKWIANAMSTEPVNPTRLTAAIKSLYAAADLKEPRVVIVSSPRVMAFAGGFAAAIWWARKNGKEALDTGLAFNATADATLKATRAATFAAAALATIDETDISIRGATRDAMVFSAKEAADAVIRDETNAVIGEAANRACGVVRKATEMAIDADTRSGTSQGCEALLTGGDMVSETLLATSAAISDRLEPPYAAPLMGEDGKCSTRPAAVDAGSSGDLYKVAAYLSNEFGISVDFMLRCVKNWWNMAQGGNMWGAQDSYLSVFRDVFALQLPQHEKYKAWEACAVEGGYRIVHEEFCIVSDRPEILRVDNENRPHCENGPSHRWRDGWCLYHWHGVKIPGEWVTGKPPSAKDALTWSNIEQRRAACEIRESLQIGKRFWSNWTPVFSMLTGRKHRLAHA